MSAAHTPAMKQPSIAQMKARMGDVHRLALRSLITGERVKIGEHSRTESRVFNTLFGWGAADSVQDALGQWRTVITDLGKELLK